MEIRTRSLTPTVFKEYGQVMQIPRDRDKAAVATEFITFWRMPGAFCVENGDLEIGVCTVKARIIH